MRGVTIFAAFVVGLTWALTSVMAEPVPFPNRIRNPFRRLALGREEQAQSRQNAQNPTDSIGKPNNPYGYNWQKQGLYDRTTQPSLLRRYVRQAEEVEQNAGGELREEDSQPKESEAEDEQL